MIFSFKNVEDVFYKQHLVNKIHYDIETLTE